MLNELLKQVQECDVYTRVDGVTNHLPMALIAMEQLGAKADRLVEFHEKYSHNLIPLERVTAPELFKWKSHLGSKEKLSVYLDYYLGEIATHGIKLSIENHINVLIQGCAAAAFHGLIRLSYGISIQNEKEVAFGLAHLSSHYLSVPAPIKSSMSADEILNNALVEFSSFVADGDSITERLTVISQHPNFSRINYYSDKLTLRELNSLFSDLYLRTRDFTVLQAITSCHALRLVLPYVANRDNAMRIYWSSIIAAVLSVRKLEFNEPANIEMVSFAKLDISKAVESDNDHVIKLVHSCVEEYEFYKNHNTLKVLNFMLNQ